MIRLSSEACQLTASGAWLCSCLNEAEWIDAVCGNSLDGKPA
jgi:hypothetical protein